MNNDTVYILVVTYNYGRMGESDRVLGAYRDRAQCKAMADLLREQEEGRRCPIAFEVLTCPVNQLIRKV